MNSRSWQEWIVQQQKRYRQFGAQFCISTWNTWSEFNINVEIQCLDKKWQNRWVISVAELQYIECVDMIFDGARKMVEEWQPAALELDR